MKLLLCFVFVGLLAAVYATVITAPYGYGGYRSGYYGSSYGYPSSYGSYGYGRSLYYPSSYGYGGYGNYGYGYSGLNGYRSGWVW